MTALPIPEITPVNQLYFEGCALGELRIRHCPNCGTRFRFAHDWCPMCWSVDIGWQKASGLGSVSHFSVVYQPPTPAFETPYILALIDLEEGVRLMSNVLCEPDAVYIGMPVQVSFQMRGSVHLPVFVPR